MPDPSEDKISGSQRAAILLMSLGEQSAADILRHLEPREVQKLGLTMANLANISKESVENIIGDFVDSVDKQTALGIGSQDYIRNVLVSAVGEDRAGGLVDKIMHDNTSANGLEKLKWMEPRTIAESISKEHPQIIAIMISHLDDEQSAEVLTFLPESMQADVIMRVATMDGVPPAALLELNEIIEKQFSSKTTVRTSNVGGIKVAANIMNHLDAEIESNIIEKIKSADEKMGEKIEDLMFVFDDLMAVPDRDMQALLRDVSSDGLLIALKGASEAFKEKVFKNMSTRAAEMMKDDLEAKGPVKLSEVEVAQKEILATARKMADEGNISLGGKGSGLII